MKLIRELVEQVDVIEEASSDGVKNMYITGVYLQAGIKNKNNRIYPPPVLEREANRYVEECVKRNCAWGELGHPETPKLNEDRISHRITELKREGNNWMGKAIVCDTRNGGDVKAMIRSGGTLGISSRGLGTLQTNNEGVHTVNDDYRLMVGGDVVLNPSAPAAWLDSVVEGADWWLNEKGEWRQGVERTRQAVHAMSAKAIKKNTPKLYENFIQMLGQPDFDDAFVVKLAKDAKVSTGRVQELWERALRDGLSPVAASHRVKRMLGL